jgi:8-oxo-dGTP pyrophosphatase MutT (NUDIX family)
MPEGRIRVIALAVVQHRDRLLVFRALDWVKGTFFYRPLGGGVEFGERGIDAVMREFMEETGTDLVDVRHLGTLENIFTLNDWQGHEIVLLYEGRPADPKLYDQEVIDIVEANGEHLEGLWAPLADCESGALRLVPETLLEFLKRNGAVA